MNRKHSLDMMDLECNNPRPFHLFITNRNGATDEPRDEHRLQEIHVNRLQRHDKNAEGTSIKNNR